MITNQIPSITSFISIEPNLEKFLLKDQTNLLFNRKSKFSFEEDQKLIDLVNKFGSNSWVIISEEMKSRNPRQCRERYNNYLKPELSNECWSFEEDVILVNKYSLYGSHWSRISKFLPKRSENSIRNRWNYLLRKSEKIMSERNTSSEENTN